jgi:ferredoxin
MIKDDERCIRCGLCAIRCPTDAMTMERFTITERYVAPGNDPIAITSAGEKR